jgi:hypothetical protein
VLVIGPPAQAKLVYVRPQAAMPQTGDRGAIVVARDDGSAARVIAHGHSPLISPNGKFVAFFARARGNGDSLRIVPSRGGRSRLLLRHTFAPGPAAPFAWSHDSRHIAAASSNQPAAVLVDVRTGKRRSLELDFQFDGASFSPDDSDVVIDNGAPHGTTLLLAHVRGGRGRPLADGTLAVWVRDGIFFGGGGIRWLRRPGSRVRTVYKGHGTPLLFTVGASADGRTVLAAEGPSDHQLSPVLIDAKTHDARSMPTVFSEIDAVSQHGRRVLGVAGGNVVVAARDGTTTIVATHAINPSWTG